nr:osteopetrosis-associated transmembrane protein 1-like [Aedes albopictus]
MGALRFLLVISLGSILAASSASGSLSHRPHPPPDRDCEQIRNFVADYAKFLKQMSLQTYPVNKFCSSNDTVFNYQQAVEWFGAAKSNESCAADFHHNRLNVIQTLYDQMTSIWESAHCADCVSNQNETAEFMELYDAQQNCTEVNNNPCDKCAGNYTEMQNFYEKLVKARNGIVCFDIEDRMNQTRYAWSAVYNCCKGKQHSQEAFIWFASGISGLPIVFYMAMYFITRRKEARERAAAPLLNDQVEEEQPEAEQPQAGTSHGGHGQTKAEQLPNGNCETDPDQCSVEEEPKLINNLNITRGVRESRLIDLQDSGSENFLNSERHLKLPPQKNPNNDDDDVSLIGA